MQHAGSLTASASAGTRPFARGLRDGLPISLGYFAVGFTIGIAAKKLGLTPLQVGLMAFLMHASAGEFALLSVIGSQGSYLLMFFTQLVVNLRYVLMSCSLSQKLQGTPYRHRFLLSYFITDELFGLAVMQKGQLNPRYYYGAVMVASPGWALGTVLGATVGAILPLSLVSAFGIALYGMFLAIIIPAAKTSRSIAWIILASMAASGLCTVLPYIKNLSSNFRIIVLTLVISAVAAWLCPIKPQEVEDSQKAPAEEGGVSDGT